MRPARSIGPALVLAVAASSPAEAAEPSTRTTRTVWYGWQTLAADGVSASLLVAAGAWDSPALLVMGLVGYGFGAPTVHWAHLQLGRGLASLGCRMVLPAVGAIVGGVVTNGRADEFSDVRGPVFGALVGMLFPVALDAAGLAYEDVDPKTAAKPNEPRPLVTVAPRLSVGVGRGTVGLGGTF